MLLAAVRIANFRALRSASITFEPTTVLIGENDCGRSSVMEAVALALGWNSGEDGFGFQPFHFHGASNGTFGEFPIAIHLQFAEGSPGEWNGAMSEDLRSALPAVLEGDRRFCMEVTHDSQAGTHWTFRSGMQRVVDSRVLLAWLRRRMPVFWMAEGMVSRDTKDGDADGANAVGLAAEVSRHYRELLEGTTPDVAAAVEHGSTAARQLLLSRAHLSPTPNSPAGEVLEEITGKRKIRPGASTELLRDSGTASRRLGTLLLTGALLRSGAGHVEEGVSSLTLIENPEAHLHPMTLASIWGIIDAIGGQKVVATHSGSVLASARLSSMRRLTRCGSAVKEWLVPDGALTADELRRYSYHLRSRRAAASFARCWLLVEGETEYWLMAEMARVCGYDLAAEGVTCVEFAQCGLGAVLKVANHLGIKWHLLADGDSAGQHYIKAARAYVPSGAQKWFTRLPDRDVEHCFWSGGYDDVFRKAAWPNAASGDPSSQRTPAKTVIHRAIARYSKPYLAVLLLDAVIDRGAEGIPPPLRRAIEACVSLARGPQ